MSPPRLPKTQALRFPLAHVSLAVMGAALALLAACAAHPVAPPPSHEPRVRRVGTSGDYPPFSTLRDGQMPGFDAALLESYTADRGYRIEWVRFRWPELVADLGAQRFELAASVITVRPEQSLAGRTTVPVARNGALLLLRRPGARERPSRGSVRASACAGRARGAKASVPLTARATGAAVWR